MLGRAISKELTARGHEVAWFSRHPQTKPGGCRVFRWNPGSLTCDTHGLEWADGIINLAGESIGDTPWTAGGRRRIRESRMASVQTLYRGLQQTGKRDFRFTGVSGAGYYGTASPEIHTESDPPGDDFPARVAADWEHEYEKIRAFGPATFCLIRLAVVLSNAGGAFPRIALPFRLGLGACLGSGRQPFNWIHEEDAARIFADSLEWNGIFNASAPAADTNADFTRALGRALGRPLWLPPVPGFVLRAIMGERAGLVLNGNWSSTAALEAQGYSFRFPSLDSALADLAGSSPHSSG